MNASTALVPPEPAATVLLDARAVAALLACSRRHLYRLVDAGRMPSPLHVGHLVRWRRSDLDEWLAAGCPSTARNHQ
jgi:excisionase family DNA binding protein